MITIKIMGAGFTYADGTVAIHQVDTTIEPGSTVALTGPNGSGKTTLARLINGILTPTRGKVIVGGLNTLEVPASIVASKVGCVFQNPKRQIFAATVRDEAAFGPINLGLTKAQIDKSVKEALGEMDLLAKADVHPYDLNPSEMKRLALASVLSMNTPVLILDEPTASLDTQDAKRLVKAIDIAKKRGATVIIITHDMDFAAEYCQRMIVMRGGRLTADGTPAEIFSNELCQELIRPSASRLARALELPASIVTREALLESLYAPNLK